MYTQIATTRVPPWRLRRAKGTLLAEKIGRLPAIHKNIIYIYVCIPNILPFRLCNVPAFSHEQVTMSHLFQPPSRKAEELRQIREVVSIHERGTSFVLQLHLEESHKARARPRVAVSSLDSTDSTSRLAIHCTKKTQWLERHLSSKRNISQLKLKGPSLMTQEEGKPLAELGCNILYQEVCGGHQNSKDQ